MIPTIFNGMIALMMVRFALNDAPHALGLMDDFIDLNLRENRAKVYRIRMGYSDLYDLFDKDYRVRLYRGLYQMGTVEQLSEPGAFWTTSLSEARSYAQVVGVSGGRRTVYYVDLKLSDIVSPEVKILAEEPTVWEEGVILPIELQKGAKVFEGWRRTKKDRSCEDWWSRLSMEERSQFLSQLHFNTDFAKYDWEELPNHAQDAIIIMSLASL